MRQDNLINLVTELLSEGQNEKAIAVLQAVTNPVTYFSKDLYPKINNASQSSDVGSGQSGFTTLRNPPLGDTL